MPTYTARCPRCGKTQDFTARIADRDDTPVCCVRTERLPVAPMVAVIGVGDHWSVTSPVTGETLYGRSQYRAHLKQHDVLPFNELKGEADHRKKAIEAREAAERREAIAEAVARHS